MTGSKSCIQSPLVSVIVPTYNAERYLNQALESVRNQTYKNLEILAINDGSIDNSLTIMLSHARADERIRVIDKENEGYGATCNRGIYEARGEWIAILEPDDWIEKDMYADMLAFASMYQAPIDIIKSAYWRILMPDTSKQRKINCSYKGRIKPDTQPFAVRDAPHLLSHHPSIWSALYRREFLDVCGIRFREYPGAGWADNPFLVETLCQTERILYLDRAYYCYREETPEKTAAFARRNPLVPIERWQDMADVLERLDVCDEAVWRAHNSRGFTYLSGVMQEVGAKEALENPALLTAVTKMFERMDASLVFSDDAISPENKQLFARIRGIECPHISAFGHGAWLVKQGMYVLHNTGIRNVAHETACYLLNCRNRAKEK